MKIKSKKAGLVLLLAGGILAGYGFWLSLRPVDIVAVHENDNHSYVLVKSFPFTDKGKINWWLNNKDRLKDKYKIPRPSSSGHFTVVFWDFGDGYKEDDKYDRLCFNDMKTNINCIDKEKFFTVWGDKGEISFGVYDGIYYMQKNGEMVKTKYK